MAYKLGRLPHDPRPKRVRLRRERGATLTPPATSNWAIDLMLYMAVNDSAGCCTISSKDHLITGQEWFGQTKRVQISDAETIKAYSAITGYDPATGANDNGATMQESLDYWRKTGISGYSIESFAQIDATDLDMIRTCIDAFGGVDAGMSFPDFAMDQFDANQAWNLTGKRFKIDGGHCVPLIGYGPDYFDCLSWGRVQRMSIPFFQRFFDETWAVADRNWQRPDGSIPNGIDGKAANAEFMALIGQPGPFNENVTPVPPVDPAVDPPVDPPPTGDATALLGSIRSQINTFLDG